MVVVIIGVSYRFDIGYYFDERVRSEWARSRAHWSEVCQSHDVPARGAGYTTCACASPVIAAASLALPAVWEYETRATRFARRVRFRRSYRIDENTKDNGVGFEPQLISWSGSYCLFSFFSRHLSLLLGAIDHITCLPRFVFLKIDAKK